MSTVSTCSIIAGISLEDSVPLLREDDYTCDTDVMVDGDVFTYPYCTFRPVRAVKILQPMTPTQNYTCDTDVMVDGDVFTYPYCTFRPVRAVKILQPMTPTQNYFEYKIVSLGISATTIGIVGRDYPLYRHPGWSEDGIGYHADDGLLYYETSFNGKSFGPTCTTGDRVGCGVDFESEDSSGYVNVFFMKNGEQVGDFVKFKKLKDGLYPLIGMESQGEQFQYLGCWNYLPKEGKTLNQ